MPLQLYDKEKILDACLEVFAEHGYENSSVAMLAKAAGVSKALIFHHFKSKKELYMSLLDQCFEKARAVFGLNTLLEFGDFFEAKEKISSIKFRYFKENPKVYKVIMEAFFTVPDELKADIEEKYGVLMSSRKEMWEQMFERVPLKEGVDRKQAFELVTIVLDYFDDKYLSELGDADILDDSYFKKFIEERKSFLSMIRYGIQE